MFVPFQSVEYNFLKIKQQTFAIYVTI